MLENIQISLQGMSQMDNTVKSLLALGILLISVALATIFRNLSLRFFTRWSKGFGSKSLAHERSEQAVAIAGGSSKFVYWLVLFVGFSAMLYVFSEEFGNQAIGELYFQASNILLGIFLLLVGRLVSKLVEYTTFTFSRSAGLSHPETLGKLFYGLTFVVFILLAAQQVGIEIELLSGLLLAFFSMVLLAFALAFGIGVGPSVNVMISGHFLNKYLSVGDEVEIMGHTGRIVEINQKMIVLTEAGSKHFIAIEKAASHGFSIRG